MVNFPRGLGVNLTFVHPGERFCAYPDGEQFCVINADTGEVLKDDLPFARAEQYARCLTRACQKSA